MIRVKSVESEFGSEHPICLSAVVMYDNYEKMRSLGRLGALVFIQHNPSAQIMVFDFYDG